MTGGKRSSRAKRSIPKWQRELGVAGVVLGLAIVGVVSSPLWLLSASVSVAAGSLLALAVNSTYVPRPYRGLRRAMSRAVKRTDSHPILNRYHTDEIDRLRRELEELSLGRFSFDVWRVPELSVFAMQIVDRRCILMFPLQNSEALLTPTTGPAAEYYNAMVRASALMRRGGWDSVVRVFLLTRTDDISPRLLDFIERNASDGIDARLLFQDELPPRPVEVDELDFGYYESQGGHRWVMILRSIAGSETGSVVGYAIDTDPTVVAAYGKYACEVVSCSRSIQELRALVSEPMNGSLWPPYFAQRGFEMTPPHGLSDEDADYIAESVVRSVGQSGEASVLVLGLTPKLLQRLVKLGFEKVESLDQFPSKPPQFLNQVTFHTGNWLGSQLSREYSCIVFDEAFNNLTRLQLGLIFPEMKKLLRPGGHLIGRVFGRFDEDVTRRYSSVTAWQAVERLRSLGGESHEDFAPLIICLLHSRFLAFSEATWIIECERWNETLASLRGSGQISDEEYRIWRLQFSFKLLSLDLDVLIRESSQSGFTPFEIRAVHGGYVDRWVDVGDFYRIVNFESTDDRLSALRASP